MRHDHNSKGKAKITSLGVTLEPMYKCNATAHALSASVSIWQLLSKSRKENQTGKQIWKAQAIKLRMSK